MLEIALSVDLSPPRPWEWMGLDVDWFQELVDARNAYDRGRREAREEARLSAQHQKWAAKQLGEG